MDRILAPSQPTTQDRAKEAVDRHFIRLIGNLLLRRDRRSDRAELNDLPDQAQRAYERDAAFALLTRDPARHTPALYAAAEKLVGEPLERMPREARMLAIADAERAIGAYRAALAGEDMNRQRALGVVALDDIQHALPKAQGRA